MALEQGTLNPLEPGLGLMPGSPATDVMGNPSTAMMATAPQVSPGADALAKPKDTGELSLTPPSGGTTLGQIMSSPHLQKVGQSVQKSLKANPELAAQPGGWAKALVGAFTDALGDAAVADTPQSSGALGGIARTMAARGQRVEKQKQQQFQNQQETDKNKALMAESNTRMVHEQALVHKMGEDEINQSIATGTQAANKLKTAASPAPIIAEGLTSDELKQYLKDNKIDPTKETAFPTGRKQIGVKEDGSPDMRTTYTAMGVPPEVTLDPEKPEDKKILDDMNKYAPPSQGKWGTTGKQTMTGQQFNWVSQQVADSKAATMARDKTLVDQKLEEKDNVRKMEAVTFGGADWTNALSNAPNHDPIAARNAILANPQISSKYPNLDSDLRYQYGDKNYDKMLDDYQKKVDTGIDDYKDLIKKADAAKGEEAASLAETFQAKLTDPNTPASLKPMYQRKIVQLNAQSKASADYNTDLKARQADAEQKASEGDLAQLYDMALGYEVDPDKLFSRFKGMKQKQEFEAEMHRRDPNWSESNYKAKYTTVNDFRPEGKGGLAKQSLNTFAGHVGDANSLISTLQNTRSPLLNTPLNKVKEDVLGQPQFIAYKTAISAAADEYINFLLNQKAKHASDDELAAKLTSTAISPGMAQTMLRQMANTVAIRARSLNKGYRDQIGKDIPNYLDPDTEQVLKTFGIDPKSITAQGTSGLVKPTAPTGAASPNPGKAANGNPVWKMSDGTVQDASGKKYNPQTGQPQ